MINTIENMKNTIIAISVVIGLSELGVIVAYFCVFNGTISSANQDWDTFIQIFNGLVMTVLTAVNIYIFYQLTVAIEDKNQERTVKQKVSDAQSVITQMRVSQYEEMRNIVSDVRVDAYTHKYNSENLMLLKKKMMAIDMSMLFKNDILEHDSFLFPAIDDICKKCEKIEQQKAYTDEDITSFVESLSLLLKQMENYIILQQLRDADVIDYIQENREQIDSVLNCIITLMQKILPQLEDENKTK